MSPEGSSKNLDLITPETTPQSQSEVEGACERAVSNLLENFKGFIREGKSYIVPFSMVFGDIPEKGRGLIVLPFVLQIPLSRVVEIVKTTVSKTNADAFVVVYDGYTSIFSPNEKIVKPTPQSRKDSLVGVWRTKWGSGKHIAIRYSYLKELKSASFDPPMEIDFGVGRAPSYSVFDGIFRPSESIRH